MAAVYDLLFALPDSVKEFLRLDGILDALARILPLSELGLAWILPAFLGLLVGLAFHFLRTRKRA